MNLVIAIGICWSWKKRAWTFFSEIDHVVEALSFERMQGVFDCHGVFPTLHDRNV
jgi:hypothetical protein